MEAVAFLSVLACAGLLAGPPAYGADATASRPDLAQGDRCGPQPMKPMSCLSGAWICRCHAGGQICEWELVGCEFPGSLPPRPGEPRSGPPRPDDPARPGLFGR